MKISIKGLAVNDDGLTSGLPILFVHGFPFDHTMWNPQAHFLGNQYRVLSYDLRGFSGSPSDELVTIESHADDVVSILDHLKINRAVLCGFSMGGYIALRAIERFPDRFMGLILCDTKSAADTDEGRVKRAAGVQAVQKDGVFSYAKEFIKSVVTPKTLESKPDIIESLLQMINKNSKFAIANALLAMAARTDTTPSLAKINVPTLVMTGEEDKLIPLEVAKSAAAAIKGAQLKTIPDAAHMSNLENSEVFNEALGNFLARLK